MHACLCYLYMRAFAYACMHAFAAYECMLGLVADGPRLATSTAQLIAVCSADWETFKKERCEN